jgi:hypothetical protein
MEIPNLVALTEDFAEESLAELVLMVLGPQFLRANLVFVKKKI